MADAGESNGVGSPEAERRDTNHSEPTSDGAAVDSASSPRSWPRPQLSTVVVEFSGDRVVSEKGSVSLPAAALAEGSPFQGCDRRVRALTAPLRSAVREANAAERAEHAHEAAPDAAQSDPAVPWTKAVLIERCRLKPTRHRTSSTWLPGAHSHAHGQVES